MIRRRSLLISPAFSVIPGIGFSQPLAPAHIAFPRDHGSHPDFRIEWWYITGRAAAGDRAFGFQVTFFRTRIEGTQAMASRFAAKQVVFAHAAVTDVQGRQLIHDQRIAREGFGIAQASEADANIRLRDWRLERQPAGTWQASIASGEFALALSCEPTQPPLLQGKEGLSRKGPDEAQASYYYSLPQLAVKGQLRIRGNRFEVAGKAWTDHEWSRELLHPQAVGWDWIGMNLDDGSALTAFRLRTKDGRSLWDGGSFRPAGGKPYVFSPGETEFRPVRWWTSPLSQARYPVEWVIRTPADFYTVKAVIDNQELDSRASTGSIYWEGLSSLENSNGRRVGWGYLEMTGYSRPLRL